jgi:hypothetical protein
MKIYLVADRLICIVVFLLVFIYCEWKHENMNRPIHYKNNDHQNFNCCGWWDNDEVYNIQPCIYKWYLHAIGTNVF